MTLEDRIMLLNERLDLTIEALNTIRELVQLQSQRLDNLEATVFQSLKEP